MTDVTRNTDPRLILLDPADNVLVLRQDIAGGETLRVAGHRITLERGIAMGHKLACRPIGKGEKVLKYGAPIGSATRDIAIGEHVHLDNLKSDYTATYALAGNQEASR